jgi:hypothetical protein
MSQRQRMPNFIWVHLKIRIKVELSASGVSAPVCRQFQMKTLSPFTHHSLSAFILLHQATICLLSDVWLLPRQLWTAPQTQCQALVMAVARGHFTCSTAFHHVLYPSALTKASAPARCYDFPIILTSNCHLFRSSYINCSINVNFHTFSISIL